MLFRMKRYLFILTCLAALSCEDEPVGMNSNYTPSFASGHVTNGTRAPASGVQVSLLVEQWDGGLPPGTIMVLLKTTCTSETGYFRFDYNSKDFNTYSVGINDPASQATFWELDPGETKNIILITSGSAETGDCQ